MNKKILVIDDEELITISLKNFLKKQGYDVVVAHNGNEAFLAIEKGQFDLIVSDIRMPDLNGIEIIKKVREYLTKNGRPLIPEILITGYASQENIKEAEELKVADYIHKPFNIKEFLEVIQRELK